MMIRRVASMGLSTAGRVTATAPASSASLIHCPTAIQRISSRTQTTVSLLTPTRSAKHSLKSASKSTPALSTSSFSSRPSTEANIARFPSHAKPQEEQNPTTLELNKRKRDSQQDSHSDEIRPSPWHTPWDGNDGGGPLCSMRTMLRPEESWVLPDPIPQVKPGKLVDEWSGEPVGRSGGGKGSRGPGEESPNQAGGGGADGPGSGAVPLPIEDLGISEAFTFSNGVDEAAGSDGSSSGCGSPGDSASGCCSSGGHGSSRDQREGNWGKMDEEDQCGTS